MADEKVNVSPEESKTSEAPAPSGPGDPPAPEHTEGSAVPGGDQAAPSHAEPAAGEHTQQTVLPGMGEDATDYHCKCNRENKIDSIAVFV